VAENLIYALEDPDELNAENLTIEVSSEKPFNKCLSCEYLGNGCSGPNLNAMTVERACEFLQLRRMQLGFTYQKTADITGLSLITVKRILTGKVKDPSFVSMQLLTFALVSDPKGKYPCAMHLFTKETEDAVARCREAEEKLAAAEVQHAKALDAERRKLDYVLKIEAQKEEQLHEKDKLLQERYNFLKQKDRAITILSVLLGVSVLLFIAALVVDFSNHDVGFFWRVSAMWKP